MNDLEKIKRVEDEVAKAIGKAKQDSASDIAAAKAKSGKAVQEQAEKARSEVASKISDVESGARSDAERIIAEGKKEVEAIQKAASKKKIDAVQFVVKELRGD